MALCVKVKGVMHETRMNYLTGNRCNDIRIHFEAADSVSKRHNFDR